MRIKIDGELTPERLQRALFEAEAHVGENFGAFYNVNIYLTPYSVKGKSMPTKDSAGNDLIVHIPAIDGVGVQISHLSPSDRESLLRIKREEIADEARSASERRKSQEVVAAAQRTEEDRARRAASEAQERLVDRYLAERNLVEASSKAAFSRGVEHFNSLMTTISPGLIVAELNAVIGKVWSELVPKYPHGAKKGSVRSKPFFVVWPAGGIALMRGGDSKAVTKQDLPLGLIDSRGRASTMWQYIEWKEAVSRMQVRLKELAQQCQCPWVVVEINKVQLKESIVNGEVEEVSVWAIAE
jgi:hypothetical protein